MSDSPRGMPLLSGPPPELISNERAEVSCRKCNKEFNILFARGRRCNHCGYLYCHSCSDYQALMPRSGHDAGYDGMPVCAFCIQYLQITAGGKGFLRSLPLASLKNYTQAYGLRLGAGVLEKDDIINAIIAARTPNGCLPLVNENYYRKHAVPTGQSGRPRGLFSRPDRIQAQQHLDPQAGWSRANNFDRPDLQPDEPQIRRPDDSNQRNTPQQQQQQQGRGPSNQYAPPPGPPPYPTYTSPRRNTPSNYNSANTRPPYQHSSSAPHGQPRNDNYPQNHSHSNIATETPNPTARPTTAPPTQPRPPRPHVPTLDELLLMQEENITTLSVGVLKEILDNNHVRPGLVLEKSELVSRVTVLITAERRERVRMEAVREREEWEAQEREWAAREREKASRAQREQSVSESVEETERERRREAYRTTVESVSESESDDGVQERSERTESCLDSSSAAPETRKSENMPSAEPPRTPSPPPRSAPERSGLCVVCQDEDANIVVVDCGHLALCRACSDLIWSSTRECPLCRTRIISQARLLRVFKA